MTKLMGMECIHTWMGLAIKASGKKISSMGKARKHGLMAPSMRDSISVGRSMVKALSNGQTMLHIRVTSMTTTSME
jgi:hypothetical protein